MKNNIILSLLCFLTLFACRKNTDTTIIEEENHVPGIIENYEPIVESITGSISGFVVDESGQAIPDAKISLGNWEGETDQFGLFSVENITMNRKGSFVKITHENYHLSGRRFYPVPDITNHIKVVLLAKNFDTSIESTSGGIVNIPGGASLNFQPNSIKKETGESYSGTVHVASKWLDPSQEKTFQEMPGALRGVNNLSEETGLESYGMVAVELQGSAGEALNIADGFTAEIKLPVPQELLNDAPAEIPLWWFSYEYGIWIEEGKAMLENGFYVGHVSHFSFWNCDIPIKSIFLDLTLVSQPNQLSISDVSVTIRVQNGLTSSNNYPGTNGELSGYVPADEVLTIEIRGACNQILYEQDFGPFSNDTSLGDITFNVSPNNYITISGNLLDCDGTSLEEAFIIVKTNGIPTNFTSSQNPFEVTVLTCPGATHEIYGVNPEALTQSEEIQITDGGSVDVGAMSTCEEALENFLQIQVDGVNHVYTLTSWSQIPQPTPLLTMFNFGISENQTDTIVHLFTVHGVIPGDYSNAHSFDAMINTTDGYGYRFFNSVENFVLTESGTEVGEKISGYFSGTTQNQALNAEQQNIYVEGQFSITRD